MYVQRLKGLSTNLKDNQYWYLVIRVKCKGHCLDVVMNKYLIPFAFQCGLSDKSAFYKQHIRPVAVNKDLLKLKEINPHYKDVVIQDSWADVSEKSDPALWKLLTDENAKNPDSDNEMILSDGEIEDNNHVKEEQMTNVFATVMHNIHGPNISSADILNLAPGENQIPVSFTSQPNLEALAFPK